MTLPAVLRSPYAAVAAVAAAYVGLVLIVSSQYYQLVISLMLLWSVMALGWNTLSGYSGMISFGHASFWGLGAYTVAICLVRFNITPWLGIPLGVVVGMASALVIGYPTFRLRGHYFALAMLAYPLALLYIFEWLGFQEVVLPMKRENAAAFMQFQDQRVYAMLALALLVAAMLAALRVERSRFGLSLLAIKQNEPAAEAAGIDSLKWKLRAIVLSGAMASAAGGLYAVVILVLTPASVFGVIVSSQALVLALSGGVGTVWGPLIGAAVLVPLAEVLHGELGHILPGIQGVVYGLAVILVILAAPEGVYWKVRDWLVKTGRVPPSPALAIGSVPRAGLDPRPLLMNPQGSSARQGSGEPLLELRGVTRSFGGLQALQGVSFKVPAGALQGIIGPNGSGKTTLFNVLNGFLPPDGGEMLFRGEPLGGLKPNRICRLGIARTFQVVRVFPRLSALQNAMIGALVATRSDGEAEALAMAAVERVGLKQRAHILAGVLTNKERRLMELARALASRPRLILMDETLAGLSRQETDEMLELLQGLNRDGLTIVIIEHTMHAMVRLADNFIVLDHGRMVTEGKPEDVVRDKRVIEAYLGKKWVDRVSH